MIEVQELTKSYGGLQAIRGISFSVEKGEILGFLGPNGAGKTSTMRILTCFMPPTTGRVIVAGYDCMEQPLEVKKRVGYLPESAPLYSELKVSEFLSFVASVKGLRGESKRKKVAKAMEQTGITEVQRRLIRNLSKGYRQRVCLAQAFLNDPPVLILDEPTEGLDPRQIVEIRQLIKNLAEGDTTVILSTHILPEVSILCDRVVIIHKGKIIAVDSPENLAASMQKKSTIEVIVGGNLRDIEEFIPAISGVTGVRSVESTKPEEHRFIVDASPEADIRRELSAAIVNKGFGLLEIKQKLLSLEEVFVGLVTEEEKGPEA